MFRLIKFTKFEHTETEKRVNLLTETRTEKKYSYLYGMYEVDIQVPVETVVEHSTTVVETKSSVIDNIKVIELYNNEKNETNYSYVNYSKHALPKDFKTELINKRNEIMHND